jgi:hypothetical protein
VVETVVEAGNSCDVDGCDHQHRKAVVVVVVKGCDSGGGSS